MRDIKRGDERLYYDGKEIQNVKVLSARRTKKEGIDGTWYRLKFLTKNHEKRNGCGYRTDLEVRVWQPDKSDFVNLW